MHIQHIIFYMVGDIKPSEGDIEMLSTTGIFRREYEAKPNCGIGKVRIVVIIRGINFFQVYRYIGDYGFIHKPIVI
jgi:hypothetical protein